jgi:HlyD family secretion protein
MKVREKMSLQITPTTVKREEYGGILGEVTEVSAFPVTQQEAIDLVGHADILPGIMTEGPHIAVYAQLATHPTAQGCQAKYQWSSSKGPTDQCFAPGTTTQVHITVEKRRPLSYVLPILKEWTGIG